MIKPTIGRIVIYRTDGRNGMKYDLPAIITCTKGSHPGNYPDGHDNPLPVPSSDEHVHLTVFTPGGFGTTVDTDGVPDQSAAFKGATNMVPGSGTYVEWDVPFYDPEAEGSSDPEDGDWRPTPRSWRWPVIK